MWYVFLGESVRGKTANMEVVRVLLVVSVYAWVYVYVCVFVCHSRCQFLLRIDFSWNILGCVHDQQFSLRRNGG